MNVSSGKTGIKGRLTVLVDTDVLSSEEILAVFKSRGQRELHGVLAVGGPAASAGGASGRARFPTKEFFSLSHSSRLQGFDVAYTLNQSPEPS